MKISLRGASGLALFVAAFGVAPAFGQATQAPTAPQEVKPAAQGPQASEPERVVVTGQLIAGASEDAPLPVETFDLDALKEQGSPNAKEFLRNLNLSSEAVGYADGTAGGSQAGFANANLRGLGGGRTMILLNGKRFWSTDGTADINTIPDFAIGRVDVLKDGASVTYGAGAVGGVINYITRQIDGIEVKADYKTYDKSAGEGGVSVLWGKTFDAGNILAGVSYGWKNELHMTERDYPNLPYTNLPNAYLGSDSSPSNWTLYNTNGSATPVATLRDYTRAQCQAADGDIARFLNTASPTTFLVPPDDCLIRQRRSYDLVEKELDWKGYFESNFDLSETQRLHVELQYSKVDNPQIRTPPTIANGGGRATEGRPSGATLGAYSVPYAIPLYNTAGVATGATAINPNAQEFYNRVGFTGTRGDLASSGSWRPAEAGPNLLYPNEHRETSSRERWGGTISLKGDFVKDGFFGRFLPENTTYELSGTWNLYSTLQNRPGVIKSRMQNAMRGYGGADCKAIDRVATVTQPLPLRTDAKYGATANNPAGDALFNQDVFNARKLYDNTVGIQSDTAPGTNGCQYFNPFASAYATNLFTGAPNTAYGGKAFENTPELWRWMMADRGYDTRNEALTIDAILAGEVPGFELPGGKIGWAGGLQWRQTETRGAPLGTAADITLAGTRCTWGDLGLPGNFIGQEQCVANVGPYYDAGLVPLLPFMVDRQVLSVYGELQIPVLDNLNFQIAGRHEEYRNITGDIWKIAGKYDVLPWLAFRASYSTNFAAPPDSVNNTAPQTSSTYSPSLLRSIPSTVITVPGIQPEDDKSVNLGVIFTPELFGGQLRASADFWEFSILGEIGTTPTGSIFPGVPSLNLSGVFFNNSAPNAATLANCSSPFINFVTFDSGCTQGVTNGSALTSILQYQLNTGGFITNGIDYQADYTHQVGPGELTVAASATQVLVYKIKGYSVPNPAGGNIVFLASFDGLGSRNFTRAGNVSSEWRGNASVRYRMGDHNFNLRANYISGVLDDSTPTKVSAGTNGAVEAACSVFQGKNAAGLNAFENCAAVGSDDVLNRYGYFAEDLITYDFTYIWTPSFMKDFELRFSILDLTDEGPMAAQNTFSAPNRVGYLNAVSQPRGRQFNIGLTKKF